MRILVLGGTAFLSRTVAAEAARRGHAVTSASRGRTGPPAAGVRHVVVDRDTATSADLVAAAGVDFDAVVDVARTPSHVRRAVEAFPRAHWVFVSTLNVYADTATPGGTPQTLPLLAPIETDEDPASSPEAYGGMKVACEQLVQAGTVSSTVVRAGLIVGPGDPSGRFSYWPSRLADPGEVIAPGAPDDPVQVLDVRDLATWLVDLAESGTSGAFDAMSPPMTRVDLLTRVGDAVAAEPRGAVDGRLTWVPTDFLVEQDVAEWSGPRSLPLWIADPGWRGFLSHEVSASLAAGLRIRPIEETARDTLAWLRATPDAVVTGLTREEEAEVLRAWRDR